ncbi:zinc-binding dehydrogenase [Halobacillus litoralis]|uniref:zinc-binding dehydrogenase n=1 Tax=Halobacillus litoralis TaxID=45668 RepID=UPI001CD5925E|nr:zinc-binding dehydrogenase [Halobacillus litoralis]MCA0968985.1 zinc-binding dehydrogenase [Halobacillus litoralis]
MKAIVHEGKDGFEGLSVQNVEEPSVSENEVKIKVKAAGMNRRDVAVVTKRHKGASEPLIPGSDASGIVVKTGEHVTRFAVGDEVIVNPGLGWKHNSDAPPEGFEIVGLPDHGTFAEYYTCTDEHVEKKPGHLSFEEAAVLPLAALTAYRALFTKGKLKEGQTVMLPGIGSGVLTCALLFAKAVGARVIVTSRSEEKLSKAKELGADVAVLTEHDWAEELKGETVDLLLESIGKATFEKSLGIIRKGGTIVTFGATTEDEVTFNIRQFFYGQYQLLGSTMGSAEELKEMLTFVEEHQIKPQLDRTFNLDDYQHAFQYIQQSENFGKIGFKVRD